MRNALIESGVEGWTQKRPLSTMAPAERIGQTSPAVALQLRAWLAQAKAPTVFHPQQLEATLLLSGLFVGLYLLRRPLADDFHWSAPSNAFHDPGQRRRKSSFLLTRRSVRSDSGERNVSLKDLRTQASEITRRVTTRMERAEGWHLGFKVGLILIGGTLASGAQFMPDPSSGEIPWKLVLGLGGSLMALAGGIMVAFVERDAPKALELARSANDQAQVFLVQQERILQEVSQLRRQSARDRYLFGAARAMREAIEQSLSQCMSLPDTVRLLLNLPYRSLTAAMGFEAGERWTLSVFEKQEGAPTLVRIAGVRAERTEEGRVGREWGVTEGYVGAAFTRSSDVILDNAQEPGVLAMIHIPQEKYQASDTVRYRSVAAIPVRVDGDSSPWGVVVATSDIVGRFERTPGTAGSAHAEGARLVAGMVALAIATAHKGAKP